MTPDDWRRGEVAVIGLGRSGDAATRLLRSHHARVYASDAGETAALTATADALRICGADVDVGRHDVARVAKAALVVVSPGVPLSAPPLVAAREAGASIVSEVELGVSALPSVRYIAITGTNGKSTVTHITAHLLRALGFTAEAAGNIGTPVSGIALRDEPPEWLALEMSSYQLHDTPGLSPVAGILTNLSADHLDRYASVDEYFADKALLFRNATPASRWVVNFDDPRVMEMSRNATGMVARYSARGRLADAFFDRKGRQLIVLDAPLIDRDALPLLGDHNVGNALAAALAVMLTDRSARTLHGRERIAAGLRSVRPLPHRLETVAERDGVVYINDSKATNVASAIVGVESMTRPAVLLLGGKHKGEPYTALIEPIRARCRSVIVYGAAAPQLLHDLDGQVPLEHVSGSFAEVVARARAVARSGDAILLSPACSSFDMFLNYEERGRAFAQLAAANGGV